jgi:hypothetical protein
LTFRSDGPTHAAGDPVLLAQALSNLIDNALKYAPENGMIEVAVHRRPDGAMQISVTDNGPGINDAEKSKVVERFYRGDASRGTPGVGLGLSLVQAVAKLHGSTLELSDHHPGLHAVFTMAPGLLPASPSVASTAAAAAAAVPSAAATTP